MNMGNYSVARQRGGRFGQNVDFLQPNRMSHFGAVDNFSHQSLKEKDLPPLSHQSQRIASQCSPYCFKIGHSVFSGCADKTHDLHIILRTFFCSEAAGNLLLYFAETDGSLCFIIGEGHCPIGCKAQNVPLVIAQPLQQAENLALSGASTLPFRLLGCRIFCHALLDNGIIAQPVSLQHQSLKTGFFTRHENIAAFMDFYQ